MPSDGCRERRVFEVLILAAARLRAKGLEFDVAIAGEGGEGPALRALVDGGLSGRVHVLGYRADVRTSSKRWTSLR